jgi:hypothetical protein
LLGIVSWSSGAIAARSVTACGGLTAVTPIAEHARWIVEGTDALNQFSKSIVAGSDRGRRPRYMNR